VPLQLATFTINGVNNRLANLLAPKLPRCQSIARASVVAGAIVATATGIRR
jgi:hypothetical protein